MILHYVLVACVTVQWGRFKSNIRGACCLQIQYSSFQKVETLGSSKIFSILPLWRWKQ